MNLSITMKQHRVYRKISLYVGIRNGLSCTSKKLSMYPHFVFYNKINRKILYDISLLYADRRSKRLPPLYRIPLRRQNAQLLIPDAVYSPRRPVEYELFE